MNVLSAVDIVLSQFTPIDVSQRLKPKEQAEYGKKYWWLYCAKIKTKSIIKTDLTIFADNWLFAQLDKTIARKKNEW